MKRALLLLIALLVLLSAITLVGCKDEDDDDDDDNDDDNDDNDDDNDDNDDTVDDDTADDDTGGDDDDDDDDDDNNDDDDDVTPPPPVTNEARAAGFQLFYKERVDRLLLAWNRFGLVGDACFGTNIHKHFIAKDDNYYEIQGGETDNNDIGLTVWTTWNTSRHFAGRNIELSLIRMFEGMAFYEAVSGHSGLTSREVIPGWTRIMNGVDDTITRTRYGNPLTPPVTYAGDLEQEMLDTFYDGIIVKYRENPGEYYWNLKPIVELENYAVTWVFSDFDDWLHISNCCGSWMRSKTGIWEDAWWGNHNSRDNFPDMALGYLAAFEAAEDTSLPSDVRTSAQLAAAAGHRVGDRIIGDRTIQMTVDEHHDYFTFVPGGQVRPDGRTEWQDLGSLASCTTAYLAKAITTEGLDTPVPVLPMSGSVENSAIQELLRLLGFEDIPIPAKRCKSIDDAFFGLTWREFLDAEVFGVGLWDVAFFVAEIFPDLFPTLVGSTGDDFKEMEMGAMALCYYADTHGKPDLLNESRQHLSNLIDMHYILAELAYAGKAAMAGTEYEAKWDDVIASTQEHLYVAAYMGSMYGIEVNLEDLDGFSIGHSRANYLESVLSFGDTSPWAQIDDTEIMARIQNELDRKADNEPWIVERYWDRFSDGPPIRVKEGGVGYEAENWAGEWSDVETPWHQSWSANHLLYEMPLCTNAPWVFSCEWAALGCARPDLDDSGSVDTGDQTAHDALLVTYDGVPCDAGNEWCEGADLDQSGYADQDDADFMAAAQGCTR